MSKKIISLVHCLLMILPLLCVGVAASPVSEDEAVTVYGFRVSLPQAMISFSSHDPSQVNIVADQVDPPAIYAGTYTSGLFYGVDREGKLFRSPLGAFARTYVGTVVEDVSKWLPAELTYDYKNGRLLLLAHNLQTDVRIGTVYAIDMETAAVTQLCQIGGELVINAFAADPDGTVYGIDSMGDLYLIDITSGTPTKIGSTGHAPIKLQSMCFERQRGRLYWARYTPAGSVLCLVNTATGETSDIGVIADNAQITGLCVAEDAFRVQFDAESGGSAGDNGTGYYQSGERVSITATPDKGYTFGGWEASGGVLSSTSEETATLVMPNPGRDVTVKAFFVPSNKYTERTVRDNEAGVTVVGKSVYYNATVTVGDFTGDAYNAVASKIGKQEIVDAMSLSLDAHASQGSVVSHKGNVTVSVRVDSAYEGKTLTVWQAVGDKIVKANGTVRDGVLTYKTSTVAPMILTPGGGFTFGSFLLILLIVGLVAVGVLYVLHLVHMKRLRARQAARKAGRPIPKTIPLRVRIGRWIRSLKK